MVLIYLNYRFWLRKWKLTYAKFLNTFILDSNGELNFLLKLIIGMNCNASPRMNNEIFGALFTLKILSEYTTQFKVGAKYSNIYRGFLISYGP